MKKAVVILGLLAAIGTMALTSASGVAQEILDVSITKSDRALAAGESALRENGIEAQAAVLVSALQSEPSGDAQLDEVAFKLATFAKTRSDIKNKLLKVTNPNQLVRLSRLCENRHDYSSQKFFAEAYLSSGFRQQPALAEMLNTAGRANLITNNNTERALSLWNEAAKISSSDTSENVRAKVYTEAVRGPESIAALEAAHEIGWLQSRAVGDTTGAYFSHHRVIAASQKPFFLSYIASPDVAVNDKAELLYKVLFNCHQGGEYIMVPGIASQIFGLIGYEGRIAEKTAFAIPMSQQMGGQYAASAEGFFNFVRAYPLSPDAPRASLYCAQSYRWANQFSDAMVQFAVTAELYPGTKAASDANHSYQSMQREDSDGSWLAEANQTKVVRLAELKRPLNPATVWIASATTFAPPAIISSSDATTSDPATIRSNHHRYARLASVLSAK